jgi:hypothetical protein
MIAHADVLERLRGIPVRSLRWLVLKDELVQCNLQIRCLDQGSIDPLVVAIREQLGEQEQMTIEELSAAVGGTGNRARRVVSEVLRVLMKGNEIQSDEDQRLFKISPLSTWSERAPNERVIEKEFRFLPRSNRFEPKIKGVLVKKIPNIKVEHDMDWCDLPDENRLYSEKVLAKGILEACRKYYRNRAVKVYFEETDTRLELLQRSRLMFVDPRFVDASVINSTKSGRWIIHRCYLYETRSWNSLVYSYPQGPEQKPYSDSLNALILENPASLHKLRSVSKIL